MPDSERTLHAVVVGINRYQDAQIANLRYATADARAFYEHLVGMLSPDGGNVRLILNEEATLRALRTAIGEDLARAAMPDDIVLLFFAGHGSPETDDRVDHISRYLIMHDTEYDNIYATGLDIETDLMRLLERIDSRRVVIFMDTCFSGRAGGRTFEGPVLRRLQEEFRAGISSFSEFDLGEGRIILSACDDDELAEEDRDLGHGIFTYCLLETLLQNSPSDPLISVMALYDAVAERVTQFTNGRQHPVLNGRAKSLKIPYFRLEAM